VFVPVHSQPPSQRAQELGQEITRIVKEYHGDHRNLSWQEVNQSFRVAQAHLRSSFGRMGANTAALVSVIGGLVAMFLGGILVYAKKTGIDIPVYPILGLGALIIVLCIMKLILGRNR